MADTSTLTICLDKALLEKLTGLAHRLGHTPASLAAEAIAAYVDLHHGIPSQLDSDEALLANDKADTEYVHWLG